MGARAARRVIANLTLSLDGRTTGPGGDHDMSWIVLHAVTDEARDGLIALTAATTVLLGRRNYQGFGSYWPHVARDAAADPRDRTFARWLDGVEKIVFSSTLTNPAWPPARIENRPAAEVVRVLRGQPGGDIAVLASQSLIRALLAADEIDRLSINLAPVIAGAGTRLFPDELPGSAWRLTQATPSSSGAIWALYDRVRNPAPPAVS